MGFIAMQSEIDVLKIEVKTLKASVSNLMQVVDALTTLVEKQAKAQAKDPLHGARIRSGTDRGRHQASK